MASSKQKTRNHKRPAIVWFRRDLRLSDHSPLLAAIESGHPVIPLYIYDTFTPDIFRYGDASKWWLHQSLVMLEQSLQQKGSGLILRQGPAIDVLREICRQTSAIAIYFHHSVLNGELQIENDLVHQCEETGMNCKRFQGELLFNPADIKTGSNTPYKVFTPFWRACLASEQPSEPKAAPERIQAPDDWPETESLNEWQLCPSKPDWASPFKQHWSPGEQSAFDAANNFVNKTMSDYQKNRDYPHIEGTSRLSPHLQFGEISIRTLWHKTFAGEDKENNGAATYRKELGWREFSYHLLHHWPNIVDDPFQEKFLSFQWHGQNAHLKAWQQGQTGYPLIDAAMRQLWQTGWMHNRMRMIVGSFLVKNLQHHWHRGRDWFFDTLLDADLANNTAGWQWVAGTGADAAPYFRIFNPVTQSEKFDKKGIFIRSFVPELAKLPDKYIHDPSNAPEDELNKAGITLGQTYPKAIVDLKLSREQALKAYAEIKNETE